ncbi:hypothetical protein [Streptosporangium carneum]|uniref:Uncharacterized protein n=1 Tax=Streptosporangium carneum TaxID=47481 RepID=A0A9W6HWI6_9ACTN|nr:hypothetical protein [Streptosporangium carneum]GLK07327.1 hypothetical protein GCM10017600_07320 [Streptosporangium carneum]
MADYEFPSDLIEAQQAYWAADARVQEVTDALPSSLAIVSGEAVMSDEQRAELEQVRAARLDALEVLDRHPRWATVEDRYAARLALRRAAEA